MKETARERMSIGQRNDLLAAVQHDRVGRGNHGVGLAAHELCESGVDFGGVPRIDHDRLQAKLRRTGLRVRKLGRSVGIVGIHQQRDARGARHEVVQELHSLGAEYVRDERYAGYMAARPVETIDQPKAHRVAADREDDWDHGARALGRARRRNVSSRRNGDYASRHQLGCKRGERLIVAVCPTLLDAHVAALDETGLRQSLPKRIGIEAVGSGRSTVEKANQRCTR